ncbi:Uncharacterised protein [uncultured archaeon]|nr:Uncharacterised protein [uncultured archaeon]
MKLSESLRRGIMETFVGGIINKFKVSRRRRDTLFFEELLARYILECERAGFGAQTQRMGEEWGFLITQMLASETIRRMPPQFLFNIIIANIWHNLGLIDRLHAEKSDNIWRMSTENEAITRCIGENKFMLGFYMGNLETLSSGTVFPLKSKQKKESGEYTFKLRGNPISIKARSNELYRKLNDIGPIEGYTLKDALKRNIFTLSGNRVYFRGRPIMPVENTLVHIIGKFNVLPEKVAEISYEFFKEIVKEDTRREEKLVLLKTIFQITGWGAIRILADKKSDITLKIRNLPHGLLLKDDWTFLLRTILGYLWLIDRELKIAHIKETRSGILVEYSH